MVELDTKYRDSGLTIMGFPSADFNQEFKDNAGILKFLNTKHPGVLADGSGIKMMDRISVNPPKEPTLWSWLKQASGEEKKVRWNFSAKFLVSPDGTTVKRYSGADPNDCEEDIVAMLPGASKSGL